MTLRFFNTKSGVKEEFKPLDPTNVRMYVCGPTVYDRAHIGNARPVIVFDVLYRLLRQRFGEDHVRYVRNITDVDDKIIAAAHTNDEPINELTARTIIAFHRDIAGLNTMPPDAEPRATQHIAEMIAMVSDLIRRNFAYHAEDHVLFHVPAMNDYGALSHRSLDDMIAGARVEVAPYKKHPADFVLWKPSQPEEPGWKSPWGRGRPGWHLECSVMSEKHLGASFDIHGGGQDLIFPHHENERAQSLCARDGTTFAKYWMHNGFVTVEGEKMSKSLGNFLTIEEALNQVQGRGEAARLLMLGTHYRKPLDWTLAGLREAKASMDRLYTALRDTGGLIDEDAPEVPAEILEALDDDLNTPLAISVLYEHAKALNKATATREKRQLFSALRASGSLLGVLKMDPVRWFDVVLSPDAAQLTTTGHPPTITIGPSKQDIEDFIAKRDAAREAKNFSEADRIRDVLAAQGILLEDTPGGTRWKRS